MKRYEHRTATGVAGNRCDDPEAPEGPGWRLVAATQSLDRFYWFWEREVVL